MFKGIPSFSPEIFKEIINLYLSVYLIARTNTNSPKIPTTMADAIVTDAILSGLLNPNTAKD